MSHIVGLCGSPSRSSRTRAAVQSVIDAVSRRTGVESRLVDVADLVADLGVAQRSEAGPRLEKALKDIETASLLIAGSPVYKGSYTGLFKHVIDLLDYPILYGTPVGLIATGGSERHALVLEHQMRPLFAFFCAQTLPTAVFIAERDLSDGEISEPLLRVRLDQLIGEAVEAVAAAKEQEFPA